VFIILFEDDKKCQQNKNWIKEREREMIENLRN